MKPFLDINSQLLTIYSRGMKIGGKTEHYNFLLRKNYYNSVNVYGRLFFDVQNSDKYKLGSSFDEIITLYHFDKNLRDITLIKILEVEANLRSTVSHLFAKKFPEKNSYKKTSSFNLYKGNEICTERIGNFSYLQKKFNDKIKLNFKPNRPPSSNSIDHYMRNYNYVPIWVIINYLTFGELVNFIKLLDNSLLSEISKSFARSLSESYSTQIPYMRKDFLNNLELLVNLRNRVAHDNTLLFYKSNSHPTYSKFLFRSRNISSVRSKHEYYYSMCLIQMFISKDNFLNFEKDLQELISDLERDLKSIQLTDVMNYLGIPMDWKVDIEYIENNNFI